MATIANLMVKIGADITGLTNALNKSKQSIMTAGKSLTVGISLPVAGAGAAIIKTGADFEQAMSSVTSLLSDTEKQSEKSTGSLHNLAIQMGADTAFGAVDAAKGIEELIKAGVSMDAIVSGGLKSSLDLAVAGELDLASAAEIASTALNSFSKDGLSVEGAANILAGAANASATSVSELKESLAAVASVASAAGQTFDGTTTALAIMAQNGLKGSDAGTSLKTMLMGLQPTTKAATSAMKQLGIITADGTNQFINANGSFKSMSEIAGVLQNSMAGLTDAQRLATMETIFGSDAVRAANILYKEGEQGFIAMSAAMGNTTAAEVAAEKMNNLKGSVEQVKGSLETAAVQIYETNNGPLKSMVDMVGSLIDWFSRLSPQVQQIIIIVGLLAAAMGPLMIAIAGVTMALNFLAANPIVLIIMGIIAAIALLVGAFMWLWKTNESFRNALIAIWDAIKTAAMFVFGYIQQFIMFIFNGIQAFWDKWGATITQAFQNYLEILRIVWTTVFNAIWGFVQLIFNQIKKFWDNWGGLITAQFKTFLGILQAVFKATWATIQNIVETAIKIISSVISLVLNVLKGNWKGAWEDIKNIGKAAWDFVVKQIKIFGDYITNIFGVVKDNLLDIWDGVVAGIKGSINTLIGMVNGMIDRFNGIKISIPRVQIPSVTIMGKTFGGGSIGGQTYGVPQIPKIPMLETGTNFMPQDSLAFLHQGEAVVPKKYNDGGGDSNRPINIYLGNELIYSSMDEHLGNRLIKLGGV